MPSSSRPQFPTSTKSSLLRLVSNSLLYSTTRQKQQRLLLTSQFLQTRLSAMLLSLQAGRMQTLQRMQNTKLQTRSSSTHLALSHSDYHLEIDCVCHGFCRGIIYEINTMILSNIRVVEKIISGHEI